MRVGLGPLGRGRSCWLGPGAMLERHPQGLVSEGQCPWAWGLRLPQGACQSCSLWPHVLPAVEADFGWAAVVKWGRQGSRCHSLWGPGIMSPYSPSCTNIGGTCLSALYPPSSRRCPVCPCM